MVHVQPFEDQQVPFIEYLTHGRLLLIIATQWKQNMITQLSEPFVLNNKKLQWISITGQIHECIAVDIIEEIICEAYKHEGTHFNFTSTWHYVLHTPYWWLICRRDVFQMP